MATGLVGALLLASCSIDPPPPDRFFRIETPAPSAQAAPAGYRVQVAPAEAAGLYTERPLVFEREGSGGTLEQYHYYFWTEPPDLLLTDALVQYLRGQLGGGNVYGPGVSGDADFIVRPKLRKLDHKLGGNAASAVLGMQFTIEDAHRKVLDVLDYEETAPAGDGAPAQHVKAVDDLAARAFARLAARLASMTPPKREHES